MNTFGPCFGPGIRPEKRPPREDGTVRLLWVWSFLRPECGTGLGATNIDQRTPETMLVVLSVVVASVLLLWLLLVLVVVVAVMAT